MTKKKNAVDDNVVELHPMDDDVTEINKTYAVILLGNQTLIMKEGTSVDGRPEQKFISIDSFKNWMQNRTKDLIDGQGNKKKMPLAKYWLEHKDRREYQGVVFRPGKDVPGFFNLWTGWAVKPSPKGSCKLFLAHLRDNVCRVDDDLFHWVQSWFANIFQNPCELKRVGVSLAIRGREGTGKTKVPEIIGSLIGDHYVSVSDPRFVTGHFNAHMRSCILLCADEGFWAGDKTGASKLRDMITGNRHPIEHKGRDVIWVDNHIRLLVIGEDNWIVPAAMEERRTAVLDMGEDHINDFAYFAAIDEEMDNGGREALLDHFLNFKFKVNDLRTIPNTDALTDQKTASFGVNERWWWDVLSRGELPELMEGHRCNCTKLHTSYLKRVDVIGRSRRSTETELGRFLGKMLGPAFKKTRNREGNIRPWFYTFAPLAECRASFDELMRTEMEWDDQGDWENEPI